MGSLSIPDISILDYAPLHNYELDTLLLVILYWLDPNGSI